jgi:elongation factor G
MRPIVIALLGQTQADKTQLAQSLCKLFGEPIKNTNLKPTTELRVYRFNYQNMPFYLLDTPGDENFVGEVLWALKVADLAILVSDSTHPIKYHVKRLFEYAKKEGVPMMVFVNKVDHEKSVWAQNICDLQDELEIIQNSRGLWF